MEDQEAIINIKSGKSTFCILVVPEIQNNPMQSIPHNIKEPIIINLLCLIFM